MEVGTAVRIIAAPPGFYKSVSIGGPDPMMLGRQGRVKAFAMNDKFEPGWQVDLTNGGEQFFYEEELEVIEQIEGLPSPQVQKKDAPPWYDDLEELKSMLFQVQVIGKDFYDIFGDWYSDEGQVEDRIERLSRGEK